MARNRGLSIPGLSSGGAVSLLPTVFLGVGFFMIYKWLKNSGGLSGMLGDAVGVEKPGTDVSKEKSKDSFDRINSIINAKRLVPNALHTSAANSIFDLINEFGTTFFSSVISQDAQLKIYQVLRGQTYTADIALIYQQYGVRRANNRQSAWLGFIWDDTEGDLRQHASRFMDGENREKVLHYIDLAVKTYLT